MLPSDYQKLTKIVFKIATVSDGASHFTALKLQLGILDLNFQSLKTSMLTWRSTSLPHTFAFSAQAPVSQLRLRRGTESRSSGSHGLAATSGAALCLVAAAGAVRSRKTTVTWELKQPGAGHQERLLSYFLGVRCFFFLEGGGGN